MNPLSFGVKVHKKPQEDFDNILLQDKNQIYESEPKVIFNFISQSFQKDEEAGFKTSPKFNNKFKHYDFPAHNSSHMSYISSATGKASSQTQTTYPPSPPPAEVIVIHPLTKKQRSIR